MFVYTKRLVTAAFIFAPIASVAQDPCELKKNADGIRVYTCKTENAKYKSLRAEFELKDTSFEELKIFLWNVSNYTSWQYNMVEAETLDQPASGGISYRSVVDAPWPVENRELLIHVKEEFATPVAHFYIHSFESDKPVPTGLVRVPLFDASWKIDVKGKDLQVVYSLRIDPGGSVPAWLANIALAEGPFNSFRELKRQVESQAR